MQHQNHITAETVVFPKDWYRSYLAKLRLTQEEKLSHQQMKKIFVTAIRDFQLKRLSLDELAGIGENLWTQMDGIEKIATELGDLCNSLTDLACPICQGGNNPDLSDLYDYYAKHSPLAIP